MGVALDLILPLLLLGLTGYARNNKAFSDGQKNGITAVLLVILAIFVLIRIWP